MSEEIAVVISGGVGSGELEGLAEEDEGLDVGCCLRFTGFGGDGRGRGGVISGGGGGGGGILGGDIVD